MPERYNTDNDLLAASSPVVKRVVDEREIAMMLERAEPRPIHRKHDAAHLRNLRKVFRDLGRVDRYWRRYDLVIRKPVGRGVRKQLRRLRRALDG